MPRFPTPSPTVQTLSADLYSALAERVRRSPGEVFRLHVGDTWREPWEGARAEAQRTADRPLLHTYSPVHGEPELLDAIVARTERRHGVTRARAAVQVVAGASSGISVICQALLDPGDEVILPAPFWPLVRGIIASRGAVPVQLPLWDRLGDPGFDVEAALEAAVTPRAAALYLNSPHNPTGHVLSPAHLDAVARVAQRHDLWIISDEVYEDLYFGPDPPPTAWTHPGLADRTLAVHSVSKAYGLAGARVGWVHGPEAAVAAVRAVHTTQVYCAPHPMQLGAARALREADPWLAQARDLYREAGRRAAEAVGIAPPEAGTFVFFDAAPWLDGAPDVTPLLLRLADQGVVLTPGASAGDAYPTWTRLCFTAVAPAALDEALSRLRRVLGR